MHLTDITAVKYDTHNEHVNAEVDRIIREMEQVTSEVLTEGVLEEGIKDIIKKGAEKVNNAMLKGRVKLDQMKMNIIDKVKAKHGDDSAGKLVKVASKAAKPALMIAVVGAAMLGMADAEAASAVLDQAAQSPDAVMGMVEPSIDPSPVYDQGGVSPKLVGALTDQMDGIFKASTEGGMKALSGQEAVQTAAQAHGVSPDEMIQHLMKNVGSKEELVGQFKKWVGAGIKKSLGMDA